MEYTVTGCSIYFGTYMVLGADGLGDIPPWFNAGLGTLLVGVGIWFLRWLAVNAIKPFVESTCTAQTKQTEQMIAMSASMAQLVALMHNLEDRLLKHMAADENTDNAILRAIEKCGKP